MGGILVCALLLSSAQSDALLTAALLLAGIVVLYCFWRPKKITEETLAELSEEL